MLAPNLSVQSCWQHLVCVLTDAGIDCARQEATILLQHVTHQSPIEFYCNLQRALAPSETCELEEHLSRRLRHEPLQYILGASYFYGREFYVDSRVLIPRPETELLIETALGMLPDLPRRDGRVWLADVGTGSASIAVTLACQFPTVRILALDRSGAALEVARINIARHAVDDRVHLLQGDLLTAVGRGFGAIVANLPYIRTQDIALLSPEVSCFEPCEALDGGAHGLAPILRLCRQAPSVLLAGGSLVLEVSDDQADELLGHLSKGAAWDSLVTAPDLRGIRRVVVATLAK